MAATKRKPRKPKTESLKPRADSPDPERRYVPYVTIARTGGVRVNEDTALTLGAVWACVRVISESLAGLPWHVFKRRADGGQDVQLGNDIDWLLDTEPNPETPAFQFRETLVAHALTWGNGYAEIERDAAGRPVWLWQLTPDRVEVVRFNGRIIYDVTNERGPNTVLESREMFHLRGLGFDGLVGYPVIRMAARAIGGGIAVEDAGVNLFANDTTPGGVLSTPNKLSPTARENLFESWKARHGGPGNRRTVAILEEDLKWQQTGLPPEDAQLIEQRQFTPTEICRWFRVPPHKIADLTRSTNNNIEHQSIEFVNDTLRPWAERLETEADIKLFGRTNRGLLTTVLDLNELKRGDTAAQTNFVREVFDRGIFSVNDGRQYLGMNKIGEDGDKRFVMANMQLLEKAGEEPIEPPVPPPDSESEPGEPDEPDEPQSDQDRLSAACMPVLVDACQTIAKREQSNSHLSGDSRNAWLSKHREYMLGKLTALADMFAAIYTASPQAPAHIGVTVFVDNHLETLWSEAYRPPDAEILRTYILSAVAVKGAA